MLPPLSPGILTTNPNFEALYKHLTTHILSSDGSTLSKTNHYTSTNIQTQLHEARVSTLSDEILVQALEEVSFAAELSSELRELTYTISQYLRSQSTAETDELMVDEVHTFTDNLRTISNALSMHIVELERTLAMSSAIDLQPNTASVSVSVSAVGSLSSTLQTQTQYIAHSQSTLQETLSAISTTLLSILDLSRATIHARLTHLELHEHGRAARHVAARSAFLGTVAQAIELKSRVTLLNLLRNAYGPQTVQVLKEMDGQLEQSEHRAQVRERELQELLRQFQKENVQGRMDVLGKRYGEVEAEMERVKRDIERLEREITR